jgi:hypothetical protein
MYFIDEPPNVYRTAKDKIDIQGRNSFWRQFQMAPQAEDNGHEDGLHEGVTGVDGIEGPGMIAPIRSIAWNPTQIHRAGWTAAFQSVSPRGTTKHASTIAMTKL